jgi:fluoroquinolone resistance protein
LIQSDLRTAMNFTINPENCKLKKAKFTLQNAILLLDKYGIEIDK